MIFGHWRWLQVIPVIARRSLLTYLADKRQQTAIPLYNEGFPDAGVLPVTVNKDPPEALW